MSPLEEFPVELLLQIIGYLPLQVLHRLARTARFFKRIINENEALVYRQAATLHGYVNNVASIDPPDANSKNYTYPFTNATSWKQYCQLCLELDRNWAGQGTAIPRIYSSGRPDVHRIKVDEERGLLLTSHVEGHIVVTCLESGAVLWALPRNYVRTHAHLEYENGFLIFDRFDSGKEVWRLNTDFDSSQTPVNAPPDNRQRIASSLADAHFPASRARFKPWCLINTVQPTFAYRFSYPTLVVMSVDTAYLWDITSATLVQTIYDVMEPFPNHDHDHADRMDISYVDVSARHLFICGTQELRVFNRSDGSLALCICSQPTFANARVLLAHDRRDAPDVVVPIRAQVLAAAGPTNLPLPSFIAAHVSRCGRHLVALLADNRLLLIEDFERVARGDVSLADAALELNITLSDENMMSFGVYLAYEFGRVSVITTSGVYIFVLDATAHMLTDPDVPPSRNSLSLGLIRASYAAPSVPAFLPTTSFPHLAGAYIPRLRNHHVLGLLSCLQMSATRLYLTWDHHRADILERLPEGHPPQGPSVGGRMEASDGWKFDIETDNMDIYDELLEDEDALPPEPVMVLHAEFGAVVLCIDFRPPWPVSRMLL